MSDHPGIVAVIVVAAGSGKRMKQPRPKQYLELGKKPVVIHSLEVFERSPGVDRTVLVVPPGDEDFCRDLLSRWKIRKTERVVAGGKERQDSVRSGLDTLGEDVRLILVHDGARPLVLPELVQRVIRAADETGAAVPVLPVEETIKEAEGDRVAATIDRSRLWRAQTPQGFRAAWLREAYRKARIDGVTGTDDAQLVERLGYGVQLVPGDAFNIKITAPRDLDLARHFMKKRLTT